MGNLNISGMSPLVLGATTLAIADLSFSPDVVSQPFRHSGNEFPSVGFTPGSRPGYKYKTPVMGIYNHLATLKGKRDTVAEIYFSSFLDGLKRTGPNHNKFALAGGANVFTYIESISCRQYGVAMADVVTLLLWGDASTFPLAMTGSVALPALGSEPKLHTFGPFGIDGVAKLGANGFAMQNNCQLVAPTFDGDKGPRNCALVGMQPKFMIDHSDPPAMITELGLEGEVIATSVALYFAGIDAITGKREATGISLTATSGHRYMGEFKFSMTDPNQVGVICDLLSSSGTHPVTVNTAATLLTG